MASAQEPTLQLTLADPEPWFIEQKIFDLLSSYLQPTSTLSSTQAAQSFDNLLPSHRGPNPDGSDKEDVDTFLWNAWEAVHRIAAQVPPSNRTAHERLASFLVELKNITSDPAQVTLANWGPRPLALWGDLPSFEATLREVVDRVSPDSAEYRNANYYLAHVLRDGTADVSFYAIRALNRAVGLHFDHQKLQKKGKPTPSRDFVFDETSLEIAHGWIQVAGEALWKACQSHQQKGEQLGADAAAWKPEDGLFPNRWRFWWERYGELAEVQAVNGESAGSQQSRDTAERTRRLMEDIQGQ